MARAARATHADGKPDGTRLHTPLAAAAHQYEGEHITGERLLHKTAQTAYVVLRDQTYGRPDAKDERPCQSQQFPDRSDARGGILIAESCGIRCGAAYVQRDDIHNIHGRQCRLRPMDSGVSQTPQGA